MLASWGADAGTEIEDRIITVLRKFGPMTKGDLFRKSKRHKMKTPLWNEALRALKDCGTIVNDPEGVHYLAETIPGRIGG
jgi:hypothetical protein